MGIFRGRSLRWLYLLALLQLVGGPLVLLQVTVFCKLALHEAPRAGLAKAAEKAWNSADFQASLVAGEVPRAGKSKSAPAPSEPKADPEKAKQPIVPWEPVRWALAAVASHCESPDRARVWTPAWPQAPPGPPPRVG